jgi:hypothetical protein
VGVRHEGASHGDREKAGPFHLHDGFVLEAFAPLAVFDGLCARRRRRSEKGLGEFLAERVFRKGTRISEDGFDFFFESGLIAATQDETGDETGGPPGSFSQRNPESNEIPGVHR